MLFRHRLADLRRHREARRKWADEHTVWKQIEWNQVLFAEELRFSFEWDNKRSLPLKHRSPDRKARVRCPMPPNNLRVHTEHVLAKSAVPKVLWAVAAETT
ncbi:hypothetical protein TNCV_1716431 [Trichonephila clavipes]|nr:hypothetical protein TNCV_1716431 [Trichonephila clavipes]